MRKLLSILIIGILLFTASVSWATVEDFTTYTQFEEDGDRITLTATNQINYVALIRNVDTRIFKTIGTNYFKFGTDNITTTFTNIFSTSGATSGYAMLLFTDSTVNAGSQVQLAYTDNIHMASGNNSDGYYRYTAYCIVSDACYLNAEGAATDALGDKTYYYTMIANPDGGGSFGTVIMYEYSDAGRTTLTNTFSLTLPKAYNMDIFMASSRDTNTTQTYYGNTKDVEFTVSASSTVGNGIGIGIGGSDF